MTKIIKWILIFLPALAIELWCYLTSPIAALFIRTEPRFDRVKRLGNKSVTLPRDYLIKPLYWYQTHDNAVDEWWYGLFNEDSYFKTLREATQEDYDISMLLRYVCRVHWLWLNCAYGFHYNLFSQPIEPLIRKYEHGVEEQGFWYQLQLFKSSFQLEAQIPLGNRYYSINIGWKAHKNIPNKLYANRIIGFRKYEKG
jgi:hypothetical protein